MTQIPSKDTQLDRLESKVDQVLDRLTRMEERQNSHGAKLDSHDAQLQDYGQRIREVELAHAVAEANTGTLNNRWAALGAVALVVLSTIGGFLSRLIAP
ncbi:hypothetical protein EQG41_18245 [Billgrantia azerbaijanica]|nr:hypothetical protein EQG41_18245 [Halomonas azerbaijanica]